ncbi:Melibiase family protein [Perilla frutescens var. hirtella]|nr:Melibiase family protein [Perilla frutescens var. hirtella]KAH6815193.1 Melibiase family protein [Perilla frutescens var. frutescens]
MVAFLSSSLFLSVLLLLLLKSLGEVEQASLPPRGWNSYDSFCWTISEEEFLQNAELVAQRLRSHGYEYVVVDYLWYRKKVEGAYVDSLGFDVIDEWGRMIPDPGRWPSSRDGKGFTNVAEKVHKMGLKFGIHVMRGISTQAFNANTPILDVKTGKAYEESGRQWHAKDIGIKERACAWMKHGFMSVNTKSGAGRAFLRSLYQQYADWGVDFVKHDCVFGEDFNLDEISYVSKVLTELNRPIVYSLSPGSSVTAAMAKDVSNLVNMYRITGDDWDTWKDVAAHFDVTRDLSAANMIGAKGLRGKSWPDLDMLPLGWLTDPGSNEGPHRQCNLSLDEQRTQMTLWSIAKSPLMFGGDVRQLDEATFSLITNPTLLEINAFSSNNMEFPYFSSPNCCRVRKHALEGLSISKLLTLGLTNCKGAEATGWSARAIEDDHEQVCWKDKSSHRQHEPFCLYKKQPFLLNDDATYNRYYDGKVHLLKTKMAEACLDASANAKLTSKELKGGSFSPCGRHANQMWELTHNGTLKNSYSGLCASMRTARANSISKRVRAWSATGRRGEIFVAFFNLDNQKADISMRIADLAKVLPGKHFTSALCKCREEWSGKDYGVVKDSVSTQLGIHASALFVLNCS